MIGNIFINNKQNIFHYTILFIIIYLIVFLKLGSFHMRWWDESMFAVNTYEMMENKKWFSLYFDGKPDLYNTKPPLTSWFQIVFVKLIGYNELSLRLPSAIATFFTIVLLFKFVSENFNYLLAWSSALVLITSYGFIHFHTSRTGDSDSLLTFFTFYANITFFQVLIQNSERKKIIFFVSITLAFLVKLYASLLFVPAYLIILLYKKKFKEFVYSWSFAIGILFFIICVCSVLYLREIDTPGYIKEVWFKDAGRIAKVVENHKKHSLFYLDNLINTRFSYWFLFFVLGIISCFFYSKGAIKRFLLYSFALIISYLSIITISVTKLEWYDMPIYPYLSILASYFIWFFISNLKTDKIIIKYFILGIILFYPYWLMFNKSQRNIIEYGERYLEAKEMFIFENNKKGENLKSIKIFNNSWKGSLLFYKYKLANQNLEIINNIDNINVGDKILVSEDKLKDNLLHNFKTSIINRKNNAELHIIEIKY